jgi:hypothetical protein
MSLFRRRPPTPTPSGTGPFDTIDAARVSVVARKWVKELGGFESPEADAALLGMCRAVTSVSGTLAEKQGQNKDDVQWKCIRQGLKEYPEFARRLTNVPDQLEPALLKRWVAFGELIIVAMGEGDFGPNTRGIPVLASAVRAGSIPNITDLTEALRRL